MKFDTFIPTVPSCRRYEAISLLCANYPEVLDYLFNDARTALSEDWQTMQDESWLFDPRRRVLLQLAICIWTQATSIMLFETYCHLNAADFEGFILALECLGASSHDECTCEFCRRRAMSLTKTEKGIHFSAMP